jgi:deoxyribose-phosphate aldolase
MDLTQLGDNDSNHDISNLCDKANNALGTVASLCVYKEFTPVVKKLLGKQFKVATVVNFPQGEDSIADVVSETKLALELGADEIDLVIDYNEYIKNGSSDKSCKMVSEVKKICKSRMLKVIIESGELKSEDLIATASNDAIANGADFIKTSTGKTAEGATLMASQIMLQAIRDSKRSVGFKASGGIRTYEQATEYVDLATSIMGKNFVSPATFRFGVSGLLGNLLNKGVSSDVY